MKRFGVTKSVLAAIIAASTVGLTGCGDDDDNPPAAAPPAATPSPTPPPAPAVTTSDGPGPDTLEAKFVHGVGNATSGQDVFRFGTFGNQGFWTDAMQLPQGIAEAGITPLQALQVGLNVNFDALNAPTQSALADALAQVTGGADPNTTAFGDPAVTLSLINQNAVIGVVVFDSAGTRKPIANTGSLDLGAGDKVGLTCAACHAITDNSVLPPNAALGTKGSVGRQVDGPTPHDLDVGTILSLAKNSLAFFPMLQLQFKALGGATIGRGGFEGLATTATTVPTEADVDRYLAGSNAQGERFYPVGQFDAFPDGVGNTLHIAPFFRTDLSAAWGIDGAVEKLEDFNNTVFTVSLDPTGLLTTTGRAFLNTVAGPVGDEIAADYEQVLRATGVIPAGVNTLDAVPFVTAMDGLTPGAQASPIGRRVDQTQLLDLNAYLNSLPGPRAPAGIDIAKAAAGRDIFRTTSAGGGNCTSCHQVDPNKFVPTMVVPMATMYPGYNPTVILPRPAPFSPVQDSGGPSPFFDNRVVVLDATRGMRGEVRGVALPLLLDLDRKKALLHTDEVTGANFTEAAGKLFDPARGAQNAHPFFINDANNRAAVVEYLRSLQTTP